MEICGNLLNFALLVEYFGANDKLDSPLACSNLYNVILNLEMPILCFNFAQFQVKIGFLFYLRTWIQRAEIFCKPC